MDISIALASVSKSLDILKAMKDIDKNYDQATYKAKIAELTIAIADSKIALLDAREEVAVLEREVERLKKEFEVKSGSVRYEGYSFPSNERAEPFGRPYCPRCEQIDGRMITLVQDDGPLGSLLCAQCKTAFKHVPILSFI